MLKIIDVGFCEPIPWLDLSSPDVDVRQGAILHETHDLIVRDPEPGGSLFQGQQVIHKRSPPAPIEEFVAPNLPR